MGTDLTEAINNTNRILGVARQTNPKIPIYFTVVSFDPSFKEFSEVRRLKRPGPMKYLASGSEWLELESSLERQPDEPLLKKKHASCFYQTTLTEMLVNETVDTLIITGCSTAGCVRATAQDAFQYGLHTIVPAGAVGDRNSARHKWALVDIDVMWGDVVTTEDVLNYLNQFK